MDNYSNPYPWVIGHPLPPRISMLWFRSAVPALGVWFISSIRRNEPYKKYHWYLGWGGGALCIRVWIIRPSTVCWIRTYLWDIETHSFRQTRCTRHTWIASHGDHGCQLRNFPCHVVNPLRWKGVWTMENRESNTQMVDWYGFMGYNQYQSSTSIFIHVVQ